jgi:hypothetical protein
MMEDPMHDRNPTLSRPRRFAAVALAAVAAWLVCPAAACGGAAYSPLALTTHVCATSELQQMAPHLAALVAIAVLLAIKIRGDIPLCLEYFPIADVFREMWPVSRPRQ